MPAVTSSTTGEPDSDAPALVLVLQAPGTRRVSILCGHLRRLGYLAVNEPIDAPHTWWDNIRADVVLFRLDAATTGAAQPLFARAAALREAWPDAAFFMTAARALSAAEEQAVDQLGIAILNRPRFEQLVMAIDAGRHAA